jgi:cell division initiation protein
MRPSITPLELRKRTFEKRMRGYDVVEVTQFLDSMADDLEELFRSVDELERENARTREELERHRQSETTLRDTLLVAQKSADSLRNSSEKEAESILAEAERQAERLMQQAMERVVETEKKIRELRMERKNFHLKLQAMIELFQQVLNFDKEEDELDGSVSVLRAKRREGSESA